MKISMVAGLEGGIATTGLVPEGMAVCLVSSGRFLTLIHCLARSGFVWGKIGCNDLQGEERQYGF